MRRFLAAVAAAALCFAPIAAPAAVTANSAVTTQVPDLFVCQFLQGTDSPGTYKTCVTATANGEKCIYGYETNNDASATHLITVEVVRSSVKYGLTAFTTASSDGYANAVPPKGFLTSTFAALPTDNNNQFVFLNNGDTIQATFATALTSTDKINLVFICADF